MIKCRCRSNDDELRTKKWPIEFAVCPEKGDKVICTATGRMAYVVGRSFGSDISGPYVEIELSPNR